MATRYNALYTDDQESVDARDLVDYQHKITTKEALKGDGLLFVFHTVVSVFHTVVTVFHTVVTVFHTVTKTEIFSKPTDSNLRGWNL